jgi:hypothetical protein
MEYEQYADEKVQFNYPAQATKYYYLTDSSGYPSADYRFFYVPKDSSGLVVPENRLDSAKSGKNVE